MAVKIKKNFGKVGNQNLAGKRALQLFAATTTRNVTSTEPTAPTGASDRTTWSQTSRRVYSQTQHDTTEAEHRTERLAAEPVQQRECSHANYRSRPQEQKGRRRRTKVCHRSSVYALQRATRRHEPEHQHHLRPTARLQRPMERRTSACTTSRSMDQRLRTSDRTVPIATDIQPTRQCPPVDNGFQKFVRSMRIAGNHQWLHSCKTSLTRQHNQAAQQLTAVPAASSRLHLRRSRGRTGPLPQQLQGRVSFKKPPHAASSPTQDTRQAGGQRTTQWEKTAERHQQRVRQQRTEKSPTYNNRHVQNCIADPPIWYGKAAE
jgi:hypothetical protein